MKTVIVTGGLGYIGSHVCIELLQNEYKVVIIDNLCNSSCEKTMAIEKFGRSKNYELYTIDIRDEHEIKTLFQKLSYREEVVGIIHMAGLKSVPESNEDPISYIDVNVIGTGRLVDAANLYFSNLPFIFSSSASVYGSKLPCVETSKVGAASCESVYAFTKYLAEEIVSKTSRNCSLRYFNPVGELSHHLEDSEYSTNLVPAIRRSIDRVVPMKIYGNDYDTYDGTCIRDSVYVVDVAKAHVAILQMFEKNDSLPNVMNIGTGKGTSVLSFIQAYSEQNDVIITYDTVSRREGDVPSLIADVSLANSFGVACETSLIEMVKEK